MKFIADKLSEPEQSRLASYVAGLLRDGVLDRGMLLAESKSAAQEVSALGKKIPPKTFKIKTMSPNFKMVWVVSRVDALRAQNADGAEPFTIDDETLQYLVQKELRADKDAPLPVDFQGHKYEGPMKTAWTARADMHGSSIKNLTKEQITNREFAFCIWNSTAPQTVQFPGIGPVDVPAPAEVQGAADLKLVDEFSSTMALESKSNGFHQGLLPLLNRQYPGSRLAFLTSETAWTTEGVDFSAFAQLLAVAKAPPVPAPGAAAPAAGPPVAKAPAKAKGAAKAKAAPKRYAVPAPSS